ncbi:MAG: UDP-3-O-(3-hydroxymyristoyl)glucosamine N-acyltransferase [Planctomycetota bacterium]|nr:MAG: UDP-3-O-(3-hydroxymyristoyl)glucosamine N-acyltransferase [Planctomycetota bacterium]
MSHTLAELGAIVGGSISGDPNTCIVRATVIDDAAEGDITLIDKAENLRRLAGSRAAAVVLPSDAPDVAIPALRVASVHEAFGRLVTLFRPRAEVRRIGVSPLAAVSPTARIAADVDVHPFAVIGDDVEIGSRSTIHPGVHVMAGCRIAEDVTIYSNSVLYEGTIVGPRAVIHAAVVLGCHGFGYKVVEGRHERAAQFGHVEIRADVEIGAGTTIDRGSYGPTIIGEGSKLDDQVMIGHNCRIGKHNLICSQVGIAGSTTTGDYVTMAGQVGVRDHVHIGDRAILGAKAGVSNDVPAKAFFFGCPATPEREQKLMMASYSKLPEMRRELRKLQRQVEQLAEQLRANGDEEKQSSAA